LKILVGATVFALFTINPSTAFAKRDSDGDGVNDKKDNCPDVWNPSQADWDNNRMGDACDPPPEDFRWSSYEKPVDLPDCESGAADVKMITTDADWYWDNPNVGTDPRYDYVINDPAYRVFCVHPGDYSAVGRIKTKNVSGTELLPRVIRHYDPAGSSPAHPVDQHKRKRAVLFLVLLTTGSSMELPSKARWMSWMRGIQELAPSSMDGR
jgi:hypothetical protein